MNQELTAHQINTLGRFCGRRDVPDLTSANMQSHFKLAQADVMVLFGGSILCGGDVLAKAIQDRIAKTYIIVGGAGHTTQTLRASMRRFYPEIKTAGLPEAEVFAGYLKHRYGLVPDYLECDSTNCGNNITNLLALLEKYRIAHHSIILCQDATMQRRMDAGLRRHCPADTVIINYAAYEATVVVKEDRLTYAEDIWGMWDVERYISLLMGEIPRLCDNAKGYGPNGRHFIAHVEIPQDVLKAFDSLKVDYGSAIRAANPLYASKA